MFVQDLAKYGQRVIVTMTADTSIILRINTEQFLEISGIEMFSDGSGYTSRLGVGSGRFSCNGHPFYFDDLKRFTTEITQAYEKVEGAARLGHMWEKDFVEIKVLRGGHVSVNGFIVQHGPPHQELRFAFTCDQTFLPDFLRALNQVAKELK